MITLASLLLLFDQSRFHTTLAIGSGTDQGAFDVKDLAVILGVSAILALVAWIAIQCAILIQKHKQKSPVAMFVMLCQAHCIECSDSRRGASEWGLRRDSIARTGSYAS